MPRFTIVVPTRNRPGELVLTLETLRQLRNADVSILVSDNSDDAMAEQNRRNVEAALAGTASTYVRAPRSMNMVDHWNFAVGHADGDFVGIVSDRLTLVPAAIEIVDRVIRETGAECICWAATIFDTGNSQVHKPHGTRIVADILSSQEILQRFAASEMVWVSPASSIPSARGAFWKRSRNATVNISAAFRPTSPSASGCSVRSKNMSISTRRCSLITHSIVPTAWL